MSRQLTATIKAQLKANFPNVKFTVSATGNGKVAWSGNATIEDVRAVVSPYIPWSHLNRTLTNTEAETLTERIFKARYTNVSGHEIVSNFVNGVLTFDVTDWSKDNAFSAVADHRRAVQTFLESGTLPQVKTENLETLEKFQDENLETLELATSEIIESKEPIKTQPSINPDVAVNPATAIALDKMKTYELGLLVSMYVKLASVKRTRETVQVKSWIMMELHDRDCKAFLKWSNLDCSATTIETCYDVSVAEYDAMLEKRNARMRDLAKSYDTKIKALDMAQGLADKYYYGL